jgi:Ca2+-transporting ATPase
VLGLQAVFIYAPFMHSIFNTVPLTAQELLFAALFGFAIFPVIGIEKWIHSVLTRRK